VIANTGSHNECIALDPTLIDGESSYTSQAIPAHFSLSPIGVPVAH